MIAAAVLAGLVLFLIVWSGERTRAPAQVRATADKPDFAPLPAPMPGQVDGASGMDEPDADASAEQPRLEEAPRREAPPAAPAPAAPPPPTAAPTMADLDVPIPLSRPPPHYPTRALRMRETGTVRVLVAVGADGVPTDVSVETSSQSRELDRAALDAVRKWRFRPAQRGGQAVAGSVVVPIEFRL